MKVFTIRVSKKNPDLKIDLEKQAKLLNISFNKLVNIILTNHLNKTK